MSRPAMLSDEAYEALKAHKKGQKDSLSAIILRFVPRPIKTFADLEEHLNNLEGPVVDMAALERVKKRKRKANHAH
jgi:predicted CopG family antitoxin